jgi:pimeloyl-ACP methyl ester carboxylesterase
MYQPRRTSRSEFVPIRKLRYHVRTWGQPSKDRVPLLMVHGWMDVAASYQFVVDAFAQDRFVVAPDWRGYGETESPVADNYWFPDYLADLDFLVDHYGQGGPVDLVGHSMGGNVAMLYTGARPQRIRRLVNLEGFGMPATRPSHAPGRYAQWMDELHAFHRGEMDLRSYDGADGVADRLVKTNGRLSRDKADWLARHWARQDADGKWRILGDAAHKIINASLFRVDEVLELYARIACPVLFVEAEHNRLDDWWKGRFSLAEFHERMASVKQLDKARVDGAGHMLHHDQPQAVAKLIEHFLDR